MKVHPIPNSSWRCVPTTLDSVLLALMAAFARDFMSAFGTMRERVGVNQFRMFTLVDYLLYLLSLLQENLF